MISFERGKRLDTLEPGLLVFASMYSSDRDNVGFIHKNIGKLYEYSVRNTDFDRISSLRSCDIAVINYKDKKFTARAYHSDGNHQYGAGNSARINAKLYDLEGQAVASIIHTFNNKSDLNTATAVTVLLEKLCKVADKAIEKEEEAQRKAEQDIEYTKRGRKVKAELVELVEESFTLKVEGTTTQEKFVSIVGKISELTQSINSNTALGDNQDIVESFLKAKEQISKLATTAPNKVSGFFGKYFEGNKTIQKFMKNAKDIKAENDSIQNNINHLFGIIHGKYEKLITTGEALQKTKALLVAQVDALEKLLEESNEDLQKYASQADIPMNDLRINTQIKASVEKYRQRLIKIDSAIMATQTTIIALGKELPAMKTDLIDEMAIGTLLSSVDDYQHMFQEIAELVSGVAKTTSEQTHTVIENLMDMQIKDTHTMDYLAQQTERGQKFIAMVSEKSNMLARKVERDAKFINEIAKGNSIEYVRKNTPLINN